MLCGSCRGDLLPGARFCAQCGVRIAPVDPGTGPITADGGTEPPKKKNSTVGLILFLVVLALLASAVRDNLTGELDGQPTSVAPVSETEAERRSEVIYWIGGTASSGSVSYKTASGIEQVGAQIPQPDGWRVARFFTDVGDPLSLSIQNRDDRGSVTCRIEVDGVIISENTSHGRFVVAMCSGAA